MATDTQVILNGLLAKRAEIEASLFALDIVIAQFGGTVPSAPAREPEPFQLAPSGNGNGRGDQQLGLKSLAMRYFDELPNEYIKDDVEQLLRNHRPNLDKLNPNTLAGVLRYLCEKGKAEIKIRAIGRSPQVYAKVG